MTVNEQAAAALVDGSADAEHSPVRIFGVRLRKFSYWHAFLLRVIQSPFVGSGQVTLWDLRTAVGVCRLRYPSSRIRRPVVVPFLLMCWLAVLSLFTRPGKDGLNVVQRALKRRAEKFAAYVSSYSSRPEYAVIPLESDGKLRKPPEPRGMAEDEMEMLAAVVGWTGWDDEKVWNLPYGYASWLRVFAMRAGGADVSFVTAEEKEWQKNLPPEFRRKRDGQV